MNPTPRTLAECPDVIALFPLAGALLLPRGQLPLNIFEPRYLAMVDYALAGQRVIGMIQPDAEEDENAASPKLYAVGCAGRLTQFAETQDGRYIITLTGLSRFRVVEELPSLTPFRQARVDYTPFSDDFHALAGEQSVERGPVLDVLRRYAEAKDLRIDWKGINEAPNEALVNALAMMSPFGTREKQALLEAQTLQDRARMLVAITEIELVRTTDEPGSTLQ